VDSLVALFGAQQVVGLLNRPGDAQLLPAHFPVHGAGLVEVWAVILNLIDTPFGISFFADFEGRTGGSLLMVEPACCPLDLHPAAWAVAGTGSDVDIWHIFWLEAYPTLTWVRFQKLVTQVPLQLQLEFPAGGSFSWSFTSGRRPGTVPDEVRQWVERPHLDALDHWHPLLRAQQERFLHLLPDGGL
jgi:hypothetical protein